MSKAKKRRTAATRFQWRKIKHKQDDQYPGSRASLHWECEPLIGITSYIHFNNKLGTDFYHWNLYVNRPHLRPNAIKAPRFGNHYIGSSTSLMQAKLMTTKTVLAFFVKILLDDVSGGPEHPGRIC
jgi:hypothetical protein